MFQATYCFSCWGTCKFINNVSVQTSLYWKSWQIGGDQLDVHKPKISDLLIPLHNMRYHVHKNLGSILSSRIRRLELQSHVFKKQVLLKNITDSCIYTFPSAPHFWCPFNGFSEVKVV
jgi:hypothetical protein